jgi:hypothetical protein
MTNRPGRPNKSDEQRLSARMTLRLKQNDYDTLNYLAIMNQISITEMARNLLSQIIEQKYQAEAILR